MGDCRPAINAASDIQIIAVRTSSGRWEARLVGHHMPVGYGEGPNSGEAVRSLMIQVPDHIRRRHDICIREVDDPVN